MSCCAAMATTTGMYIAPQYSTPSSVSLGSMSFFCHVDAGEDQQQHRDADAAHVGLDAERLPQQIADEDAEQMADSQQRGAVDDHGFVSWVRPCDCAVRRNSALLTNTALFPGDERYRAPRVRSINHPRRKYARSETIEG